MITYPPAKINIGLNVVEKRIDGYHNIESIFYPIPVYDILEINLANDFVFTSSGLSISGKTENNLVVKAYHLLQKEFNLPSVAIHLHKQIPMGAGLGGGSADAAYTLVMINTLFKLNLPNKTLERYAAKLGADCPFFIDNTPKYVTGTGNIMDPIDIDLTGYYLWLINPEIHVGTKEAYAKINPTKSSEFLPEQIKLNISAWRTIIKNDFEASIFPLYPALDNIKSFMYQNGAVYASMSGSGSTIYGICDAKPSAKSNYAYEQILTL